MKIDSPHINQYFPGRLPEYQKRVVVVDGRPRSVDLNLYKLFVERSFHLLRAGGHCGIVIPSGVYTDLGAEEA